MISFISGMFFGILLGGITASYSVLKLFFGKNTTLRMAVRVFKPNSDGQIGE